VFGSAVNTVQKD